MSPQQLSDIIEANADQVTVFLGMDGDYCMTSVIESVCLNGDKVQVNLAPAAPLGSGTHDAKPRRFQLIDRRHEYVSPDDPEYAHYGYGDYPRITHTVVADCEAETLRKAQNKFKKMCPMEDIVFHARSPVARWIVREITD